TRSSSPNVCGISPPRPEGRWKTTRSRARPERHFTDSFATMRLAIARAGSHVAQLATRHVTCGAAAR
ncbi:MAG: hypothetical protein SFX73_34585, partial [Kofleriaceae bacterium]|nr:hypothetical protein [Kofleriaceae bacterium]